MFHEKILTFLGSARMSRNRVGQHLAGLTDIFDTASKSREYAVCLSGASQELPRSFSGSYRDLVQDLGIASFTHVRLRCAELQLFLPRVWEAAEKIMSGNQRIEDD